MVNCELCGADVNSLSNVNVSGSVLKVCNSCKPMGKETMGTGNRSHTFNRRIRDKLGKEEVVSNYASLIQSAMGKQGLTVHQLARATNIKESSLTNYLKASVKLDVETAKRIGKFLDIELVYELGDDANLSTDSYIDNSNEGGASLGDMIQDLLDKKNDD